MSLTSSVVQEVTSSSSPHVHCSLSRINLRPLLQNIVDHAMEWKNTLGNILAEKTKINLLDLQMELKVSTATLPHISPTLRTTYTSCE